MSIELTRKLRTQSSAPERAMWRILHTFRTSGFHFRKQVQIGPYYVDIACHHAMLVIEVDGDTHGTDHARSNDAIRDAYLRSRGYTALRFSNDDVMGNADGVFLTVEAILADKSPRQRRKTPLPSSPARGEVPPGVPGNPEPTPGGQQK